MIDINADYNNKKKNKENKEKLQSNVDDIKLATLFGLIETVEVQ